jgi:hypothetical protein
MQHIEPHETTYVEVNDVEVNTTLKRSRGALETSIAYYNHLNQDLTVTLRNGVPFKLPAGDGRKNCVEVLVSYDIDPRVVVDAKSTFHHHPGNTAESVVLLAALENCEKRGRFNRKCFTLKYSVTAEQVEKNSGIIYIADLDLVLSTSDDERRAIHPYSPGSSRYKLIEAEVNVNARDRFGYSIYLISNDGAVGDKYINLGGKAYRVPSIKNKSLRDGVYVCSSGSIEALSNDPVPIEEHYAFDSAVDTLRLYDTPESALKLGDQLAAREQELKEINMHLKEVEHDHKLERLNYEHDLAVKKQELDESKMELDRQYAQEEHDRRIRAMRDKEYHESRSNARKDSSEIIKIIPIVLTGVIAIAAAIAKYNKD